MLFIRAPFWGKIGTFSVGAQKINVVSFMGGRHQLRWDEICEAETDAQKRHLVFLSFDGKKRLAIPSPKFWFGKDKEAMEKMLAEELQKRGLEIKGTGRAAFLQSKS